MRSVFSNKHMGIMRLQPKQRFLGVLWPLTSYCALLMCLWAGGCERKTAAAQEKVDPAIPVKLAAVIVQPSLRSVSVVGTIFGDEDTTVSNKVPGKVIAVYHDVGDRVKAGEPLAQLLQKDYELDVRQKSAALGEALAKLGAKDVPPADFDVTKLPAVQKTRFQAANAQAKYERGKTLHDQRPPLMSDQDFADLKSAWDVAATAYDAEVLTARALVADAATKKAELDIASQALADTTVRTPLPSTQYGVSSQMPADDPALSKKDRTYVVSARLANAGELKAIITPMFKLVDDNPVKLRAAVPERYFTEVQRGQLAHVTIEAYPDRVFDGRVTRKNPQIDTVNRTFPIEIVVPNDEHLLPPGAFAKASIETGSDTSVTFLPQSAILTFAGVSKVFTVQDNKAREIEVELGDRRSRAIVDGRDEVLVELADASRLHGATLVAISGTSKLATGVPVVATTVPTTQAGDRGTSALLGDRQ